VLNNGLLPVQVPDDFLDGIFATVEADPSAEFEVDLENQLISNIKSGEKVSFEINPYKKECLLKGLDDIDFLISLKDEILAFEKA
jgi:3-isopropylmalate/(R)-2-methylmalate dehydratase small subunit